MSTTRITSRTRNSSAFTLVELMTVIAVMATAAAFLSPAFSALRGPGGFNQAAYQLAFGLEEARAYAMAHNTYVYAAVAERDGLNGTQSGKGRLIFVVLASKDGTRGYDLNSPGQLDAARLVPISKPNVLTGLTLSSSTELSQNGALQTRPALDSGSYDFASTTSATPLDRTVNGTSYTFNKVIQFDPQGVARVQTAGNSDEVPMWIELGLKEARGNVVPVKGQEGAIQVAGVSGSVKVYRP